MIHTYALVMGTFLVHHWKDDIHSMEKEVRKYQNMVELGEDGALEKLEAFKAERMTSVRNIKAVRKLNPPRNRANLS